MQIENYIKKNKCEVRDQRIIEELKTLCQLFHVEINSNEEDVSESIFEALKFLHEEVLDLLRNHKWKPSYEESSEAWQTQTKKLKQLLEEKEEKISTLQQRVIFLQNSFEEINKKTINISQKNQIQQEISPDQISDQKEKQSKEQSRILKLEKIINEQNLNLKLQQKIIDNLERRTPKTPRTPTKVRKLLDKGQKIFPSDQIKSLSLNEEISEKEDAMDYIDEKIEKFVKKIYQEKEEQKIKYEEKINELQKQKESMEQELEDLKISNQKFKISTLNMKNLVEKYQQMRMTVEKLKQQIREQDYSLSKTKEMSHHELFNIQRDLEQEENSSRDENEEQPFDYHHILQQLNQQKEENLLLKQSKNLIQNELEILKSGLSGNDVIEEEKQSDNIKEFQQVLKNSRTKPRKNI